MKMSILNRITLFMAALICVAPALADVSSYSHPEPGEKVMSFYSVSPAHDIALTGGRAVIRTPAPKELPALSEPALDHTIAVLTKIGDEEGSVQGLASELEIFPDNPSETEPTWETAWTLIIPGRGMIFLHQFENSNGIFTKIFKPTQESGKDWSGDFTVTTTVGPLENGRGKILGGTGEFATLKGSFVEINRLTGFTKRGQVSGSLELRLFLQ